MPEGIGLGSYRPEVREGAPFRRRRQRNARGGFMHLGRPLRMQYGLTLTLVPWRKR